MSTLSIPVELLPALKKISELEDSIFADLVKGLGLIDPELSPATFAKHLAEKVGSIKPEDLKEFARVIFSCYGSKANFNKSAASFADDISQTLLEDHAKDFTKEKVKLLNGRLRILLSIDKGVAITSKARNVISNHDHVYCNARIVSDIRPIFSAEADSVSAMGIVHTFNITHHVSGRRKHGEFFVAMDDNDLIAIKKLIERAEKKSGILKSIIKKSGILFLEEKK